MINEYWLILIISIEEHVNNEAQNLRIPRRKKKTKFNTFIYFAWNSHRTLLFNWRYQIAIQFVYISMTWQALCRLTTHWICTAVPLNINKSKYFTELIALIQTNNKTKFMCARDTAFSRQVPIGDAYLMCETNNEFVFMNNSLKNKY